MLSCYEILGTANWEGLEVLRKIKEFIASLASLLKETRIWYVKNAT